MGSGWNWPTRCWNWPRGRWSGKRRLLCGLTVALLSGCSLTPGPSTYRVTMPVLACEPRRLDHDGQDLIVLCFSDWAKTVRELKAACLALGGDRQACGAE